MKRIFRTVMLFSIIVSVFTSCTSLTEMHYKRSEFDKVSDKLATYTVYIHDENNTYLVDKPKLTPIGIKGDLTLIRDPATIAEIKNPHTRKQLRKHKHDLNLYTKTEVNEKPNATALKNIDITDISHIATPTKPSVAEDVATGLVLGLGVAVIVGVVYAFQGML